MRLASTAAAALVITTVTLFDSKPTLAQEAVEGPAAPTIEENVGEVVVLGSRIPRIQKEGPSPVTIYTAEQIRADGLVASPMY